MKKDMIISFRTDKEVGSSLRRMAGEGRQSISSVIESAICHYLKEKNALQGIKREQRQYSRKCVSLPAFIVDTASDAKDFQIGIVLGISLGGLRVSIPREAKQEICTEGEAAVFQIIFTLPDVSRPINMTCKSLWVTESDEDVHVGAAFVDSDFQSYQCLQKHLI